jgi:hypothetical protein
VLAALEKNDLCGLIYTARPRSGAGASRDPSYNNQLHKYQASFSITLLNYLKTNSKDNMVKI